MSRYIEAEAVITAIAEFNKYEDELEYPYASDDLEEYKDDARLLIEDAPSIDIVRCEKCRFCLVGVVTAQYSNGKQRIENLCEKHKWSVRADDYCSYGEVRDE